MKYSWTKMKSRKMLVYHLLLKSVTKSLPSHFLTKSKFEFAICLRILVIVYRIQLQGPSLPKTEQYRFGYGFASSRLVMNIMY